MQRIKALRMAAIITSTPPFKALIIIPVYLSRVSPTTPLPKTYALSLYKVLPGKIPPFLLITHPSVVQKYSPISTSRKSPLIPGGPQSSFLHF